MNYLLLAFSVLINVSVSVSRNHFSKKEIEVKSDLQLFNMFNSILSVITLIVIALFMGGLGVPSLYTVVIGTAYGMATALGAVFTLLALESGPLSYTTVITSCSMVIPALSGLFFGETVSLFQYIGIGIMILSFVLAVDTKGNQNNGTNLRWFVYSMLSFLFCGSVGVMQKIHQNSPHKNELSAFLIIAFLVSAIYSLVMIFYYKKSQGASITVTQPAKRNKLILICLIIGIGFAFCNQINMYLSGVMASIIFFPVVNGGCMILTASVGLFFFKEKLSPKQMVGLVLGVIAMLLLCNIVR